MACSAALILASVPAALAKNDASYMPQYILDAQTVAVIIDPEAGVSLRDPNANQTARKDVETALLNWGRFQPIMSADGADLVIVIRKGSKGQPDVTMADPRQNRRGGVIEPIDDGISVGAQRGPSQQPRAGSQTAPLPTHPTPEIETGSPGDVFEVYEGKKDKPLDYSPGWRYVKKDGLHSHDVPAVAEFRKAVADAEKRAAQQGNKHP